MRFALIVLLDAAYLCASKLLFLVTVYLLFGRIVIVFRFVGLGGFVCCLLAFLVLRFGVCGWLV